MLSAAIAFPGKLVSFIDDSFALRDAYVSRWLRPERWEGLFSTRPEGYVDIVDMRLSDELNVFLTLYYEPEYLDFDGELISNDFCESGWPYRNVLLRGHQNFLFRNRMRIEVYDIIGGERIELGTISAVLDPPIIEVEGWIFSHASRLAIDPVRTRDDLGSLCIEFPTE
jgi:hypothetical protein